MFEWDVYLNGIYSGTVIARNEDTARAAAYSLTDLDDFYELEDFPEVSVSRR